MAAPLSRCRRCPRLVAHLDARRRAHPDHHNAPVPGWGAPDAPLVLVGLAPGANGANRTGLPFQGDASSTFLQSALEQTGLWKDDAPAGIWVTNAVRCLPPANKPSTAEIRTCAAAWLAPELQDARVILALGRVAHDAVLRLHGTVLSHHRFSHAAEHRVGGRLLIDSLHPSPLNTRTGRLAASAMRAVLRRAAIAAQAPR
ncbi:MAG: uracil-DNA glycosylase family protein [Myxococcota bacterium]|nr:uracil-DNA glycosylase family protein [Myxococcota bacterium]